MCPARRSIAVALLAAAVGGGVVSGGEPGGEERPLEPGSTRTTVRFVDGLSGATLAETVIARVDPFELRSSGSIPIPVAGTGRPWGTDWRWEWVDLPSPPGRRSFPGFRHRTWHARGDRTISPRAKRFVAAVPTFRPVELRCDVRPGWDHPDSRVFVGLVRVGGRDLNDDPKALVFGVNRGSEPVEVPWIPDVEVEVFALRSPADGDPFDDVAASRIAPAEGSRTAVRLPPAWSRSLDVDVVSPPVRRAPSDPYDAFRPAVPILPPSTVSFRSARVEVLDASGRPIPGAAVTSREAGRWGHALTRTDDEGIATVVQERGSGPIDIHVAPLPDGRRFASQTVDPVPGIGVRLTFVPVGESTLDVEIVDGDGRPAPVADVAFDSASGEDARDVDAEGVQRLDPFVGADGRRTFHGVPSGEMTIRAFWRAKTCEERVTLRPDERRTLRLVVR